MSPLAFDKQGRPFAWHQRTAKLLLRLFRNPSARGTCSRVLDAAGATLYADADLDYSEFRRLVNGVPGLYRLDQCDEDGVEIDDAPPAYVSIEALRNAGGTSGDDESAPDVSPLVIIERLVATHADVMKTMATQHAAILAASAEIMRAPYRPAPIRSIELRNTEDFDRDDEDEDQDDLDEIDDVEQSGVMGSMLTMLQPHLATIGASLYAKCVEIFGGGSSNRASASGTAMPTVASKPNDANVRASEEACVNTIGEIEADAIAESSRESRPATAPTPTPQQLAHLFAVRQHLSPTEQALVEHVVKRMSSAMLSHYLRLLSSMSIDEATTYVRSMIAQAETER
ncbi:MAG: hypothetical protein QM831_21990 [Kofleriaceae bacterium]